MSTWLKDLPSVRLDPAESRRFLLGQRLPVRDDRTSIGLVAVYGDGILLGTAELRPGEGGHVVLHPSRILPSAQERYLR